MFIVNGFQKRVRAPKERNSDRGHLAPDGAMKKRARLSINITLLTECLRLKQ